MMRMFWVVALVLCLWSGQVNAEPHVLMVDLAEDHVDITAGFDGARLVLYGVKSKDGDVGVIIRGPEKTFSVRQKESVFGIWMNRRAVRFEDVPGFYDYAVSVDENFFLDEVARKEYGFGKAAWAFEPEGAKLSSEDKTLFTQALIRNKQVEGLFPNKPQNIEFLSDIFFKTEFYIPSNVPPGQYIIETFLVSGDTVTDQYETHVNVAEVGFSAGVDRFAKYYSVFYALATVAFAVFAGWLSNVVRRRK